MKSILFLIFTLLFCPKLMAGCIFNVTSISIALPSERGEVLRNSNTDSFSSNFNISCNIVFSIIVANPRPTRVYFSVDNGSFKSPLSATGYQISYTEDLVNKTQNPIPGQKYLLNSWVTTPLNKVFSASKPLTFLPAQTANLTPGKYTETIRFYEQSEETNGLTVERLSYTITADVLDNCAITINSAPTSETIGAILNGPSGSDSFKIPFSVNCSTYQAKLEIKSTNGSFKNNKIGNTAAPVPYTVSIEDSTLGGLVTQGLQSVQLLNWTSVGYVTSVQSAGALKIMPNFTGSLQAGTYEDKITLRINGQ